MQKPLVRGLVAGVLLAAAAGCISVGPDYAAPTLQLPANWQRMEGNLSAVPGAGDIARWWEGLQDPVLSQLVESALAASTDVRSASARLREARARRALAGAEAFPSVSASASGSRTKSGSQAGSGQAREFYSAGFDARWEPDVFGGVGRGVEAAQADLEASAASLEHARVSLVAEVALNYVELRAFQARLAIAGANLESQSDTLQLTDWRAQAGLVGAVEVEQARTSVEQTRAQIPSLQTSLAQAEHRLGILLGRAPGALHGMLAASAPIPLPPAAVGVGIPADTLRQRPDVRIAERRLAAETARIGQAEAARYPAFSLSGSIGTEALTLGALGGAGTLAHSLAAGVAAVIFDAGRLRQRVEIQSAVAEQALVAYEAAILAALEDVENALVALDNGRRRQLALRLAVQAARSAAQLARQRYESGLIDFQTVLNTERTLLSIEDSLAATQAEYASALIRLYKALGGGWSAS